METQIKPRPAIQLIPVVSNLLKAIGHHPESNTLAIEFPPSKWAPEGSIYHYRNFTINDFALFNNAPSKGAYFKAMIKAFPDRFPFERIQ